MSKIVKVLNIPVRYNGVTHQPGDEFEMEDDHVVSSVEVIGEVAEKQEKSTDKPFEGMSVDELKAYADEHNIDIGNASSENGIIKKIEEAQKAE